MKAAGTAHRLGELPAKQYAVDDVSKMALACNTINCRHGQPDDGACICSCYNAWLLQLLPILYSVANLIQSW